MKNSAVIGAGLSAATLSVSAAAWAGNARQGKGVLRENSKELLRDFALKYPIFQAAPGGETLAVAVANAGGMGAVTRYSIMYPVAGHEGTPEDLAMYAGQGVAKIHDAPTASDLVRRLWAEFEN